MPENFYAKGLVNLKNRTQFPADCLFTFEPNNWDQEQCKFIIHLSEIDVKDIWSFSFFKDNFFLFDSFIGLDETEKNVFIKGLSQPSETTHFPDGKIILSGIPEIIYKGPCERMEFEDSTLKLEFFINYNPLIMESNNDFIRKYDGTIEKKNDSQDKNLRFTFDETKWLLDNEYMFEEQLHGTCQKLIRNTRFRICGEKNVSGKAKIFDYVDYYFLKIPPILFFLSFLSRQYTGFTSFRASITNKANKIDETIYGKKLNWNQEPIYRQEYLDCLLKKGLLTSTLIDTLFQRFLILINDKNFKQMILSNIAIYNSEFMINKLDHAYRALESLLQIEIKSTGKLLERIEFSKLRKSLCSIIESNNYPEVITDKLIVGVGQINNRTFGKTPSSVLDIIENHNINKTHLFPQNLDLNQYLNDLYIRRNDFIHENMITPYAQLDIGFINRLIELFVLKKLNIDENLINSYRFQSELDFIKVLYGE